MANTPEGKVKAAVQKTCKEFGVLVVTPMGGYHGNNSVPDLLFCHRGLFYGIEIKAKYPIPTAAQLNYMRDIYDSGGVVGCIGGVGVSSRMSAKTGLPTWTLGWWGHKSVATGWPDGSDYPSGLQPLLQAPPAVGGSSPSGVELATRTLLSQTMLATKLVWGRDPESP